MSTEEPVRIADVWQPIDQAKFGAMAKRQSSDQRRNLQKLQTKRTEVPTGSNDRVKQKKENTAD